ICAIRLKISYVLDKLAGSARWLFRRPATDADDRTAERLGVSSAFLSAHVRIGTAIDSRANPPWGSLAIGFLYFRAGNALTKWQPGAATAFSVCLPLVSGLDGGCARTCLGTLSRNTLLPFGDGGRHDCRIFFWWGRFVRLFVE